MRKASQGLSFKKAQAPKQSLSNKVQPSRSTPVKAKSANPRRRGS